MPNVQQDADYNWFWLIAGINGAGKSTLVAELRKLLIINATYYNPDSITIWMLRNKRIGRWLASLPLGLGKHLGTYVANLNAANTAMDVVLITLETTDGNIAIESVLSTSKYRECVRLAKESGRKFGFVYIGLASQEMAIERVAARVEDGGHGVPVKKIRKRWNGSLKQLPWFVEQADRVYIYSNVTEDPLLVAHGFGSTLTWHDKQALPHVTAALKA